MDRLLKVAEVQTRLAAEYFFRDDGDLRKVA